MTTRRERDRTRRRVLVVDLVEILGLTAIAIAQPILDVFGRAPEVFLQVDATPSDLWWFALVVTFAPPLGLIAVEVLVRGIGGPRAGATAHAVIVGALVLLIAVRGVRLASGLEGASLLVVAAIVATLVVIARFRFAAMRTWLRYAGFAPVLIAGMFVFASPAHSLATGDDGEAGTAVEVDPSAAATPRPPVVLVVFDELPLRSLLASDGQIDAERFPGFAQLGSESTWYRNATTVATHTANAVPAILTGQYPSAELAQPVAADHPDNVFRLLGNVYRFNVSELDTQLCAVPRCDFDDPDNAPTVTVPAEVDAPTPTTVDRGSPLSSLLRRAREEFPDMVALHDIRALPSVRSDDLVAATTTTAPATTTTIAAPVDVDGATPTTVDRGLAKLPTVQPGRFTDWLARIDGDTEHAQLNVLHITMPHNPWNLDSDGTRYQVPEDYLHLAGTSLGSWSDDPGAAISARQRHLIQLRYVDTLVTALRARLVDLGLWDTATIVVTADHGAGFEAGGWLREWDPTNQVNLLGVPLFVRGPDFGVGVVDDTAVQSVDIVPTIADVADIDIPWAVDGTSLLALPAVERAEHPVGATRFVDYQRIDVDVSHHLDDLLARTPPVGTDGGDDATILRNGPRGDLIGTRVDALTVEGDAGAFDLIWPQDRTFAPSDTGAARAFYVGDLDDVDPNELIVVAVDGVVQATGLAFEDGDVDSRFAVLAEPSALLGGPHDVRFYVLRTPDGAPAGGTDVLAPLTFD